MEASFEETSEGLAIVRVLAAVLDRLVLANAPLALTDPGQVTKFHAMKAPGIGIYQYLERIHKYASCSNECYILALIYIDRLIQRNNFLLTDLNVHRVVITAVLLAAKFFDDAYYNNAYYAKIGGVLVSEMNGLEVDFLFRINFSLHVVPDEFDKYRAELWSHSQTTVNTPTQLSPFQQPMTPPHIQQYLGNEQLGMHHHHHHQHHHISHEPLQSTSHFVMNVPHITPSPPSEAAMNEQLARLSQNSELLNNLQLAFAREACPDLNLAPLQRTHSMPASAQQHHHHHNSAAQPSTYYHHHHSLPVHCCASNATMGLNIPYSDDRINVLLENSMYLYHHQNNNNYHNNGSLLNSSIHMPDGSNNNTGGFMMDAANQLLAGHIVAGLSGVL